MLDVVGTSSGQDSSVIQGSRWVSTRVDVYHCVDSERYCQGGKGTGGSGRGQAVAWDRASCFQCRRKRRGRCSG